MQKGGHAIITDYRAYAFFILFFAGISYYFYTAPSPSPAPLDCGIIKTLNMTSPIYQNASTAEKCFVNSFRNRTIAKMLMVSTMPSGYGGNLTATHNLEIVNRFRGNSNISAIMDYYTQNFQNNTVATLYYCHDASFVYNSLYRAGGLVISNCSSKNGQGEYVFIKNMSGN